MPSKTFGETRPLRQQNRRRPWGTWWFKSAPKGWSSNASDVKGGTSRDVPGGKKQGKDSIFGGSSGK